MANITLEENSGFLKAEGERERGEMAKSPEGSAKATVEDQICQAIQSTSNLLRLMQESSPSQVLLMNLPKNLLAKASTIKNTGQVVEQLPQVISSLDAYMESSLQSAAYLKTVDQLLSNLKTTQLKPAFPTHQLAEELKEANSGNVNESL